MTYKLRTEQKHDFIHAEVSGERTRKNISLIAQEILEACREHQVERVLVDVRRLNGRLSVFDSLLIISREFPRIKRANIITKAVIVDDTARRERSHFFQSIARKSDYNIRMFEDVDEAERWLHDKQTITI